MKMRVAGVTHIRDETVEGDGPDDRVTEGLPQLIPLEMLVANALEVHSHALHG